MSESFGQYAASSSAKQVFWRRLYEYGANNAFPALYYDKVFRKEYQPSRIRYNQFFFFAVFFGFLIVWPRCSWTNEWRSLDNRKYYTTPRAFSNWFMWAVDLNSVKGHVKEQRYIL